MERQWKKMGKGKLSTGSKVFLKNTAYSSILGLRIGEKEPILKIDRSGAMAGCFAMAN